MRKNKIDQFAWQNMSKDEQKLYQETFKQYKSLRSELLKKNKELERSKLAGWLNIIKTLIMNSESILRFIFRSYK